MSSAKTNCLNESPPKADANKDVGRDPGVSINVEYGGGSANAVILSVNIN